MSGIITPLPRTLPSMRAGETDGRYIDCTLDLGAASDTIPNINAASITITRQDGNALTANDLQPAGTAWPNTLDSTKLIPTFGFTAPLGAAGVSYKITITVDKTTQGRIFVRDVYMSVVNALG